MAKAKQKRAASGLTRIRVDSYNKAVDGKRVKAMRNAAGLTMAEAAGRLGWTSQRWWDLEHARHPNPRIGTLLAVCDVLGCKVDDLLKR